MTGRPLYHSHAWAYDAVVPGPGEDEVGAVAGLLADRGARTVLDAGCGTGRLAGELAARGFAVAGVDRSSELVAVARECVPGVRFEVGELGVWSPSAPFDAVVCRGVLNDCISEGERGAAIGSLRRACREGGVLIADVRDWDASVARYSAEPVVHRRVVTDRGVVEFRSVTELDSGRRVLRIREHLAVDGQGSDNRFEMRCWTRAELEAALRAAGFTAVDFEALRPRRADRLAVVASPQAPPPAKPRS